MFGVSKMLFFVVLCCLVALANAFSLKMSSKSEAVPFLKAPERLKGMVGYKGFDPLGFSNTIDPLFLREAELKHGRTAMLATLGFVATDLGVKLPGEIHALSSVAAHDAAVSWGAMTQILVTIVVLEFVSVIAVYQMLNGSGRKPGDYGFDPLNFSKGKEDKTMELKEIENGRLAMVAFAGIVTQAVVTGKGFPYF